MRTPFAAALFLFLTACGPLSYTISMSPAQVVGLTILRIVNPCGDAPNVYDELLLELSDGTLLASFSANANGDNTRFSTLGMGTYTTTDGDGCIFTIGSGNAIVYENHHY